MKNQLLRMPAMAAGLAEIILEQTQGADELQRFLPFQVEDQGDMWFVSGNAAFDYRGDIPRNEIQDERFALQVMKSDCEVTSVGVYAGFKLSVEQKEAIRTTLQAEGKWPPVVVPLFDRNRRDVHIPAVFYGGIINSADAACRFAELVLRDTLASSYRQLLPLKAEEIKGQWYVKSDADQGARLAFELVLNRSNAQVTSLTLPPQR
jgi:hypothetical protein